MKILIVGLAIIAVSNAVPLLDLVKEEWHSFKLQHNKDYENEIEEAFRLKIYLENKNKVISHNEKYEQGLVSYKMALNNFADLTHSEFAQMMNGYNRNGNLLRSSKSTFESSNITSLPKSVDWRKKGYVTRVKNQGRCGSCWAFSTTGSLEGQHFRKTGVLVELSEQNLVDCSGSYGNNGCNGGLMDPAFKYIKDNHGIDTEKSYPYEGVDDECHFNKSSVGAVVKGFVDIPSGNEKKLQKAVATIGPISVAIDASLESFQFYSNGIYFEDECSTDNLDHAVLVVGYGTDKSGQDYWLVKNSWGTSWGDEGYIKMARNHDNQCGIATQGSYPVV